MPARFKKYGEAWFECHICGFDYPLSQGMRHYRSKKLVDAKCVDQLSQIDYQEFMDRRRIESEHPSPQPVKS